MNRSDYVNCKFYRYYKTSSGQGYFSILYSPDNLFTITEEYKAQLIKKYQNICNNEIEDNDNVILDKRCHFPKSIITKNKIPIKLTDSGTKVVYNFSPYRILYQIKTVESIKVIKFDNGTAVVCNINDPEREVIPSFTQKWYGVSVLRKDTGYYSYNIIKDIYPDNAVSFYKFVKYINSKLLQPSEEEKKSIISMMDSSQDAQNKLAFDILKNYDNSFALAHILMDTYKYYSAKVMGGISYKYLRSVINLNKKELIYKYIWFGDYYFTVCDFYLSNPSSSEFENALKNIKKDRNEDDLNKIDQYCKVLENDA